MATTMKFGAATERFFSFEPVRYEKDENFQPTRNVLSYNEMYVMTLGWLIPSRGSIFTISQTLLLIGLFCSLATVLAVSACPLPQSNGDLIPAIPDGKYCLSLSFPMASNLTLITLCSFVIALFSNLMLNRWWLLRTNLQTVLSFCYDILSKITSCVVVKVRHASPENREVVLNEAEAFCYTIAGLLTLSLFKLFARARCDSPETARVLVEHNLITSRQLEYCLSLYDKEHNPDQKKQESEESFSRTKARQCDPMIPVCIILTMVHEATQAGGMLAKSAHKASDLVALKKLEQEEEEAEKGRSMSTDRPMSVKTTSGGMVVGPITYGDSGVAGMKEADLLVKSITELRERILGVMLFVDVQLPMPFIQIVSAVVWTFMIQLLMMCSSFIAYGMQYGDSSSMATGYITIILYSFVLFGLLRLYSVLSNPLTASHAANFPTEKYLQDFVRNLNKIRSQGFAFIESYDVFRLKRVPTSNSSINSSTPHDEVNANQKEYTNSSARMDARDVRYSMPVTQRETSRAQFEQMPITSTTTSHESATPRPVITTRVSESVKNESLRGRLKRLAIGGTSTNVTDPSSNDWTPDSAPRKTSYPRDLDSQVTSTRHSPKKGSSHGVTFDRMVAKVLSEEHQSHGSGDDGGESAGRSGINITGGGESLLMKTSGEIAGQDGNNTGEGNQDVDGSSYHPQAAMGGENASQQWLHKPRGKGSPQAGGGAVGGPTLLDPLHIKGTAGTGTGTGTRTSETINPVVVVPDNQSSMGVDASVNPTSSLVSSC